MRPILLAATFLMTATVLSACGGSGGPAVAGGGVVPPAGTIWFGSGVTSHDTNTISGLVGQSGTVPMSNHVWFIGHLTNAPANGVVEFEVNGCQSLTLACQGQMLPGMAQLVTRGSDVFEYGNVQWSAIQQPTPYALTMLDSTGARLASGTVTITP